MRDFYLYNRKDFDIETSRSIFYTRGGLFSPYLIYNFSVRDRQWDLRSAPFNKMIQLKVKREL